MVQTEKREKIAATPPTTTTAITEKSNIKMNKILVILVAGFTCFAAGTLDHTQWQKRVESHCADSE